jgi:NADH-quinone oxidoreductase subunit F
MKNLNEFELVCAEIRKSKKDKSNKTCIIVSSGTCGQAKGSLAVVDALQKAIKKQGLDKKVDMRVTGCHGFCQVEPIVIIAPENIFYQNVKPEDAEEIISETIVNKKIVDRLLYIYSKSGKKVLHEKDIPFYKKQCRNLMANNILVDPTKIEDYIGIDGYTALCKVLKTMKPEEVIEFVKKSGLIVYPKSI